MSSWSGSSYGLRVPSSCALDIGTCSVSVSSSFMLKHWTVRILTSLPSLLPCLSALFPSSSFQQGTLLLPDHGLQLLFSRDLCYTSGEYRILIQVVQPWSLFLPSLLFTFTSYAKPAVLYASYFGVNRSLGPVPLTLLRSGVDEAVIRKGTTQFFPVTCLTSTDKVWNESPDKPQHSDSVFYPHLHFHPWKCKNG